MHIFSHIYLHVILYSEAMFQMAFSMTSETGIAVQPVAVTTIETSDLESLSVSIETFNY